MSILQLVVDQVYDESKHSGEEPVPGAADVKARLDQYVRSVAGGHRFEQVRKLVRDSYAQANTVKHRQTADRIDAGIVSAAVILLVEMLRLIGDLEADTAEDRADP